MATNDKAMKKADAADLTINAPQTAPEGYEKSVRGAGFVGYWRAETGDVLSAVLRGPAPDKVIEKSKAEDGVALVELLHEAIVTQGGRQLEGQDMSRWVPGGNDQNGNPKFLTKAKPGEMICVTIRKGIKDDMMRVDGTKIWLKVGKKRMIPGTDHAMYDYERYFDEPSKKSAQNSGGIPFDQH